jgi:uncharacterized membrane protein YhaH (DUF805 family)
LHKKIIKGKIGRKTFWVRFFLGSVLGLSVLFLHPLFIPLLFIFPDPTPGMMSNIQYYTAIGAIVFAHMIVSIPRLRDLGRSGWWCLVYPIPFIFIPYLIYVGFFPSKSKNEANIDE